MIYAVIAWFLCGFVCSLVCLVYDTVVYKQKPDITTARGFSIMTIMGFISLPIVIYLIITDIIEICKKKKGRKNDKSRRNRK